MSSIVGNGVTTLCVGGVVCVRSGAGDSATWMRDALEVLRTHVDRVEASGGSSGYARLLRGGPSNVAEIVCGLRGDEAAHCVGQGLLVAGGNVGSGDEGVGSVGLGERVDSSCGVGGRVAARVESDCGSVGIGEAGVSGVKSEGFKGLASGSSVFVSSGSSKKKMGKNQRDRAKYREAVGAVTWRKEVSCEEVKSDLRVSLEKKWAAQNELAAEKARKDLEYQRARDVDAEAKKSRARIMKETESSKVATEKAFAYLKSTGNVPGFCETVVSDGSSPGLTNGSTPDCTISPDSSASMHEFRECQKKNLDLEAEVIKLKRQLEFGKLAAGEEAAFTVHSDGNVSEGVREEINKHVTDWHDVDERDDAYGQDRAHTLFVKKVSVPCADEFAYDLIGQ